MISWPDRKLSPYVMIAPFYVIFGVFGLFPLLYTAWVALHDWQLINGDEGFVGLANFVELFGDRDFYNALFNTVSIFLLSTVPQLFAALGVAALLSHPLRAGTAWRASVLVPNVVSVAAVAIVFSQLFSRDYGVVNLVLGWLSINPVDWRSNRLTAHIAVSVMVMWRWTGYNALLYLAAMQSVPRELYEAATLDGASRWRTFWSITVPGIRPTIIFTVVTSTIGGLQLFAEPQLFDVSGVHGTGGSGREFQTLTMYLYEQGFSLFDAGYSAAIAWVMFGVSLLFAWINFALVRRIASGS